MRLATYRVKQQTDARTAQPTCHVPERAAWVEPDDSLVDVSCAYAVVTETKNAKVPEMATQYQTVAGLILQFDAAGDWSWLEALRREWSRLCEDGHEGALCCRIAPDAVELCMPFKPKTFRDFYAFERHVKTCRRKRGLDMVEEWYQFPAFYFSNVSGVRGPHQPVWAPRGCDELDYELEVGCVIGKHCTSISATEADGVIAGYVILNDWSARDIQRSEVKVGLGPAKGKDFATSLGPYLVTPSELLDTAVESERGIRHRLNMCASVNGRQVSAGCLSDLHFTFAEMIERASSDVTLAPMDLIGSGTVGTGCILELGVDIQPWLKPGDTVELKVHRLGVLTTPIITNPFS